MRTEITKELLEHYFEITKKAFEELTEILPQNTHLDTIAKDFYNMAKTYFDDAKYFMEKGDYINAFGALYYAHAWLDAGARLGLWDVKHNNKLFTVD